MLGMLQKYINVVSYITVTAFNYSLVNVNLLLFIRLFNLEYNEYYYFFSITHNFLGLQLLHNLYRNQY